VTDRAVAGLDGCRDHFAIFSLLSTVCRLRAFFS